MDSKIGAAELMQRLDEGEMLNLLDVRELIEYHTYNIGGKNVPLQKLEEQAECISTNKNEEIIVVCSAGLRSATATAMLSAKGYKNVRNLAGGLIALRKVKN